MQFTVPTTLHKITLRQYSFFLCCIFFPFHTFPLLAVSFVAHLNVFVSLCAYVTCHAISVVSFKCYFCFCGKHVSNEICNLMLDIFYSLFPYFNTSLNSKFSRLLCLITLLIILKLIVQCDVFISSYIERERIESVFHQFP